LAHKGYAIKKETTMPTAVQPAGGGGGVERPSPTGLADVIDTILDKGLVIDAYVRVSLVGIELLTIDARVVVASVDTYLRFAEAVNRLEISDTEQKGLPDLLEDMTTSAARSKTKGALEAAGDKVRGLFEKDADRGSARRK
jgi:gas vesicle structural protein